MANATGQPTPGLAIGQGRTGRAGGEDDRGQLVGRNTRGAIVLERRGVAHRLAGILNARQFDGAVGVIGQAECIGRELRELTHHLRRMSGGQQTHAAGDETGGKTDGEPVSIRAGVQHVPAGRHDAGKRRCIGEEGARRDGASTAIGHHRRGGAVR